MGIKKPPPMDSLTAGDNVPEGGGCSCSPAALIVSQAARAVKGESAATLDGARRAVIVPSIGSPRPAAAGAPRRAPKTPPPGGAEC